MKRVANAEKLPATGKVTAISPNAWTVQNRTAPIKINASKRDAGPPVARADPDPMKSPVPGFRDQRGARSSREMCKKMG